jgi:hypothetical protein
MTDPPMDPKDATAALATEMAELLAELLIGLVHRGTLTTAEAQALLMARLHPAPTSRREKARPLMLEYALLRLAGAAPGSSRA